MFFVIYCNFMHMSESIASVNIFFMTGTGNSYWAATRISELAKESCDNVKISPADSKSIPSRHPDNNSSIIAFAYPTHGFSLPWHMLKFILRFPRGKGRVILINSRAGMKMGKIFTPGVSGLAILLPTIIMLLKGYRIHGLAPIDTPSNWISIHPGIRKKVVESIFRHRDAELSKLWNRLSNNKVFYPIKFFLLLPVDLFLIPVSLGYIFFGRFLLARTYLADQSCNGCGLCAERCPVGAIRMVNNRPWWTYRCESCMRCSNICPNKSVNSSVPLMVIYTILILKFGQGSYFTDIISSITSRLDFIPRDVVYYALLWIITILASWLLYAIIFWLNNLKLFNMLFAFTTPMKYWRRYIAPGFRGKDK